MEYRRELYIMNSDLHREDPDTAKKIRALIQLGLFDHAEIIATKIYKTFELKYATYNNITYARFHGTTWNGAFDSLPTHLASVKRN